MKIGIITLPLHYNYGGILQAYALQRYLRHLGHDVEHIEVKSNKYLLPISVRYLVYLKRAILKYILRKDIIVFREKFIHDTNFLVTKYTSRFVKDNMNVRYVNSFDEIQEYEYDAYVVGSDQIWRSEYICRNNNFAPFLDFAKDWQVKRIAYACSFAKDDWCYSRLATVNCKELLSKFDVVTVREKAAIALCKRYLDTKAELVIDPTMLLSQKDYDVLVDNANTRTCNGDLMCYVLDETMEKLQFIKEVASKRNLIAFNTNAKVEKYSEKIFNRIQPPVEQWLRSFKEAELVITDSFHACVFSIIYNKPFICFGNQHRGNSRFISLLSMFGQGYRLLESFNSSIISPKAFEKPNINLKGYRDKINNLFSKVLV